MTRLRRGLLDIQLGGLQGSGKSQWEGWPQEKAWFQFPIHGISKQEKVEDIENVPIQERVSRDGCSGKQSGHLETQTVFREVYTKLYADQSMSD